MQTVVITTASYRRQNLPSETPDNPKKKKRTSFDCFALYLSTRRASRKEKPSFLPYYNKQTVDMT